ncbi:MAG TPA: ABC transporter permease [Phycisphaerales bacterium]|nr:ABC transporter permease [Phycisphaerales bacterium]
MLTLMYKDARQTFWPALLALLLLAAPPLAWGSYAFSQERHSSPRGDEIHNELMVLFCLGAVASLLAASSIAGVAFAKERRERTAEHTATLPIPRWKLVLSKFLVAMIITATPFVLGLAAVVIAATPDDIAGFWKGATSPSGAWTAALVVSGWLTLFGLGWGLSSILRSDVISSSVPILLLIAIPAAVALWSRPVDRAVDGRWRSLEEAAFPRYVWPLASLGAVGLAAGTVVSLKRKSP